MENEVKLRDDREDVSFSDRKKYSEKYYELLQHSFEIIEQNFKLYNNSKLSLSDKANLLVSAVNEYKTAVYINLLSLFGNQKEIEENYSNYFEQFLPENVSKHFVYLNNEDENLKKVIENNNLIICCLNKNYFLLDGSVQSIEKFLKEKNISFLSRFNNLEELTNYVNSVYSNKIESEIQNVNIASKNIKIQKEEIEIEFNNDLFEKENVKNQSATYRYQLLRRMLSDCNYYLGAGNRAAKYLWAGNEESQIKDMISLFNSFSFEDKPEWLTISELDSYSKELTGKSLEEHGWKKIIDENNVFQELPLPIEWNEIEKFFSDNMKKEVFAMIRRDVEQWAEHEATYEVSEYELRKETINMALWNSLDSLWKPRLGNNTELFSKLHEECSSYTTEIAEKILLGEITSFNSAQIFLNDKLLNSELYNQLTGKVEQGRKADSYTNEILDKIRAAGIEVVTDKEEFDRILAEKNIVQKMSDKPIEEEKNPLFLADENELKAFAQKVDDWKAGKLNSTEIITEFSTSTVLQAINVPANKIAITQERLEKINAPETQKIGNSRGHDIDIETIKQIPKFLADPVMVFNSATRTDSYTVMTEALDKNNETILIALQISKKQGSIIVNEITSAYGKDENEWFIEQIKLGNLVYENKQKSLEWSHRRGLSLPTRMSTQGSLNIIQKEDIVNKRTSNFDLSERNMEFTENQQEFFKEIGFTNSVDSDGNPINFSFEKKDSKNNKHIFIKKYLNSFNIGEYSCSVTENDSLVYEIKEDEVTHFNPSEIFLLRVSSMDMKDNFIIPVETLGKILSDSTLQISRGFISSNYSQMNRMDYYDILKSTSFKNKVSNLPAKFISEDIYSNGITPIGKVLTFKLYKEVLEAAELDLSNYKGNNHFLLEIQTDNNYKKVPNKDYPRLYKAKWDRTSKSYIDKTEIPLSDLDSKTISNIQYIATNNCNTELAKPVQTMNLEDGSVYGFVHNGKIYLNPEIMNSNAAVHEYTHLWDAYTQNTNPELWNKGLELFRNTNYWNEVISDPNYQNIKDDENLVLSEIHSRICGDIAEKVLNKIAELDGEQVKLDAIDWDKEVSEYLYETFFITEKTEFFDRKKNKKIGDYESLRDFLSTPMKDLIQGKSMIDLQTSNKNIIQENQETSLEKEKFRYEPEAAVSKKPAPT